MARRRRTYTVDRKAARPRKARSSWSILSMFRIGDTPYRSRTGGYRGKQHAVRDQVDMSWWGTKRGR